VQDLPREQLRPKFLKIPAAVAYSGICRTKIYRLARQHPGLYRKHGKATLVDLEILDRILNALPAARIGVRAT